MNKFWPNNAHDTKKAYRVDTEACMLDMTEHLSEAIQEKKNKNKNHSHKMTHQQDRKRRP